MKPLRQWLLLALGLVPLAFTAQPVDRSKYPDYSDRVNPDLSLLKRSKRAAKATANTALNTTGRPDHYNNANTPYFPPVFMQDGGSCGSASRICYMFSHEMNSFRGTDGKDPANYYPSHFVWLLTNGNSGKNEFVRYIGVPSAKTYGGQTYSQLFGNQNETDSDFGWMTGYDKWFEAMHNRMYDPSNFPLSVETEEGREALKNWLWNHNGDTDFHSGGIVGIGVASSVKTSTIANTPANAETGAVGKKYVRAWGTQVDHALTVVGYDDRIEFDLNGNGIYGEASADEKGAWIIVNSWGAYWANNGFIYCPYAYAGPVSNADGTFPGNFWQPEVYKVRKNYRPLRTIKLRMDYNRRSELYLRAGVSDDLNATSPKTTISFEHFKYAGDGHNGDSNPAPEVPMLGRWADGKLHDEPMEFGYDLTDLSAGFDQSRPLKYFFIVETRSWGQGEGHIYNASIIDYAIDPEGLETPFVINETEGYKIESQGKKTVISIVVPGRGIYPPRNASIAAGKLSWQAPIRSAFSLAKYRIYHSGEVVGETAPGLTSFTLPEGSSGLFEVAAVYDDGLESGHIMAETPYVTTANEVIDLRNCGVTIPSVFSNQYDNASISFWIKPHSLSNWNQGMGPGWNSFYLHGNADGSLTAGWSTGERCSAPGVLKVGQWTHVAIAVERGTLKMWIDGELKASCTSNSKKGIGGFGDFVLSGSSGSAMDAEIDELILWKKTLIYTDLITRDYSYADAGINSDILAYFKGDVIQTSEGLKLRDHGLNKLHAAFSNDSHSTFTPDDLTIKQSAALSVSLTAPTAPVYVGIPFTPTVKVGKGIESIVWNVPDAGLTDCHTVLPELTFTHAGEQEVNVEVTNKNAQSKSASMTVTVLAAPKPNADFTATKTLAAAGERICFTPSEPLVGYSYAWSMPGADVPSVKTPMAAACYQQKGTHTVTLTVTSPSGEKASSSVDITITEVPPVAAFRVGESVVLKGETVNIYDESRYAPTSWEWSVNSGKFGFVSQLPSLSFQPTEPGVYNVQLTTRNATGSSVATQDRGIIVCNADSKNGLNFMYNREDVTATTIPFTAGQTAFTIDWWMRPRTLTDISNGIGDNTGTLRISNYADGKMAVSIGDNSATSNEGFVIANEWHHYAVVFSNGVVRFYRDGESMLNASINAYSVPQLSKFSIGTSEARFAGMVDEFRVWNKALSLTQLQDICNAPLTAAQIATAESAGLQLYYQFNQSSGDVEDASSKGNTGVRNGFGPDGDAWSSSGGVFCLNFGESTIVDKTAQYLSNYKAPFYDTGKSVAASGNLRFMGLATWTKDRASNLNQYTGAHVDYGKGQSLCATTGWDGFDQTLTDHAVYQTITLPAGSYQFTTKYSGWEGQCGNSYLVVAEGEGLPLTDDLASQAISYIPMREKTGTATTNTLLFTLAAPTKVSLGMVINMSGARCMSIESFTLEQLPLTEITTMPEGIDTAPTTSGVRRAKMFDLKGRPLKAPRAREPYIKDGRVVISK